MDNLAYYKLEDINGATLSAVCHVATPPPFNERWTVTEISKGEYDAIQKPAMRECLQCKTEFTPKTTKHVFCCNRCFMKFHGI